MRREDENPSPFNNLYCPLFGHERDMWAAPEGPCNCPDSCPIDLSPLATKLSDLATESDRTTARAF